MVDARLDADERAEIRAGAVDDHAVAKDLREAYERGRRDERGARKRHPVMVTLTVVAAVVGVGALALAAMNGSFGRAGGVVDDNLATAVTQAQPKVQDAASQAAKSLKDAGAAAKAKADGKPG
jgi:hypothetical protein